MNASFQVARTMDCQTRAKVSERKWYRHFTHLMWSGGTFRNPRTRGTISNPGWTRDFKSAEMTSSGRTSSHSNSPVVVAVANSWWKRAYSESTAHHFARDWGAGILEIGRAHV